MARHHLYLLSGVVGVLLMALSIGYLATQPDQRPPKVVHAQEPAQIIDPSHFVVEGGLPTPGPSHASKNGTEGVRVQIPELNVDLPIVEGDGWNAPLYKAAHYPSTDWPGQGGRSMIYAHARPGMFGPLFQAKVGQEVDVTRADGFRLRYKITEYYASWPITDLRWFQPADFEQLVLTTCTTYNPNDPRIVVVARPV